MKQNHKVLVSLFFSLLLSACAGNKTNSTTSDTIEIQNAWARPALMMTMGNDSSGDMSGGNGAAYMIVANKGTAADRLTSVEGTVADSIQIHQTILKDNVMSMSPVDAIEVPAKGQVELKPGGYHIMLIGLKQDLKIGDQIQLTLIFEKAGRINVDFDVKNP
jgi:copper(I)-binding protein